MLDEEQCKNLYKLGKEESIRDRDPKNTYWNGYIRALKTVLEIKDTKEWTPGED